MYTRSGSMRRKISPGMRRKLARRYWNKSAPGNVDRIFSRLKERYQARFGRPLTSPTFLADVGTSPPVLPQRLAQPPSPTGIATPRGFPQTAQPQLAQYAAAGYVADFKPEWVDDREWNARGGMKTLPEILGSGKLTPEQMQNLSINNVLSLFDFRGGSEADRLEMGYLLQRFIMDGYIRGVDVVKYIKDTAAADGTKVVIGLMTEAEMDTLSDGAVGLASPGGGLPGMHTKANYTLFTEPYWRAAPETERFHIFYHEWGHQLGLPHAGDQGYVPSGEYGNFMGDTTPTQNAPWGTQHHHFDPAGGLMMFQITGDQQIDSLFRDASTFGKNKTFGAPLSTFTPSTGQTVPGERPAGFPQLGGTGGGVTGPGGPGPIITPDYNINMTNYNISPPSVTPWGGMSMAMPGGGMSSTPDSVDKTPVAGMLPQMDSQIFAAGLQDVMRKASPMINNLAGSLLKGMR